MKPILYLPLSLLFLLSINNKTLAQNIHSDTATHTKLILTQDSGYVTKEVGLAFLLANSLTDTTPNANAWHLFNQTDTIGKYYKIENSDHYIMCFIDYGSQKEYLFETHIIIEIDANGNLLKNERFFHGNYPCCWNNLYDGFSKYDNFFGIQICGTGSGFCSSCLCLFKEVIPQDSIFPIPFNYWDGMEGFFFHFYTLKMKMKKDELILHYILEKGKMKYDKNDEIYLKTKHRNKFNIKYFYEDGQWKTKDTEKLKELDGYF